MCACAARLAGKLATIPGVTLISPTQVNGVFARLPEDAIKSLRALGWHFYTFIGAGGVRLMCNWATTDEDIEALASDAAAVMTPAR